MFGRKRQHDGPIAVRVSNVYASATEIGEHEALAALQRARAMHARAYSAVTTAERLREDADEAMLKASKQVRRISER